MSDRNGNLNGYHRADGPPAGRAAPVGPPPRSLAPVRFAVLLLLILMIPVVTAVFVFPALSGQPFTSPAELAPENIKSFQVRLIDRADLSRPEDRGGKVVFLAAADDYPSLLAPLLTAREVSGFEGARGPWFGEYRVMTNAGRKGTIRLYWVRDPKAPAAGEKLRFQVGGKTFEGGGVGEVIGAAQAAEPRGRAVPW